MKDEYPNRQAMMAAVELEIQACINYGHVPTVEIGKLIQKAIDASSLDASYVLPCDVRLPPATIIRKGCKLGTLFLALKVREHGWPEISKEKIEEIRKLLEPEFSDGNWEDVETEPATLSPAERS